MKQQIPDKWRFVKLDLFDNATIEQNQEGIQRFKLAISVKPRDVSDWLYFRAALNSPRKHYKRFVKEDWDWRHYSTVLKHYDELYAMRKAGQIERVNVSKVYQKGWAESKQIIQGFSAILVQTPQEYEAFIYTKDQMFQTTLTTQNISGKQRSKNIIASASISNDTGYQHKRIEDFI